MRKKEHSYILKQHIHIKVDTTFMYRKLQKKLYKIERKMVRKNEPLNEVQAVLTHCVFQ